MLITGQCLVHQLWAAPHAAPLAQPAAADPFYETPFIIHAVPDGPYYVQVSGRLTGQPNTTYELDFIGVEACDANGPLAGLFPIPTTIPADITIDESGTAYFTAELLTPFRGFVTATASNPAEEFTSEMLSCTAIGPANTSWTQAELLSFSTGEGGYYADASHYIDYQGRSRWYKFSLPANSRVFLSLTNLPTDYNLAVFGDLAEFYQRRTANPTLTTEALQRLTAEFAPDAFSPDAFSPDAFSPDAFSPDAFSPDAFSPDAFSPDAFSPDAFSPDAFSPDAFSPDAFSPDAFSPDAFSPDAFSPDAFSSVQQSALIAVSAFPGQTSEGLVLNTWNQTGDFYVRISGRNGAFSRADTFYFDVRYFTGACSDVEPIFPSASLTPEAGDFRTLILADFGRMIGTPAELADLQTRLAALAGRPEVAGKILDVGTDSRVRDANEQADFYVDCPYAKNLVADSIEQIIDAWWDLNPDLEYLVLVGNDDVIPFFRHPDGAMLANEQNYIPPVLDHTASQASLRLGYVLSQDRYGSRTDLGAGLSALPIPDLAIGRLVETPSDILTVLDAYLATAAGVVYPQSALVTGYDFLWDAAQAVESELRAGLGATAAINSLIDTPDITPGHPDAWIAADLDSALRSQRHDLIYLAGHFSASSALAADYRSRLTAAEVVAMPVDLANAVIFSAGCHSGYNIVNEHGVPGVTQEPDWAQAFAQKGATFIGGTGYQYGDTDFIEYGERLYLNFTQELRRAGPVAVGKALTAAKNTYLAETAQMLGLHEKSFLQATLFGLPMLSVELPGEPLPPDDDIPVIGPSMGFATDPGATLGLRYVDLTVDPTLTQQSKQLTNLNDNSPLNATYWTGSDGVVSNPAEPVLPLEIRNVSLADYILRGVGLRGGQYQDIPNIMPLTGAPATELSSSHVPFLSDHWHPVVPWRTNYFSALADPFSGSTRLFVTPVQHRSSSPGSLINTARQFDRMDFRLFYSNYLAVTDAGYSPAFAAAPAINQVASTLEADQLTFAINVTGDPGAGIQAVWVTYTALDGPWAGQWQSLDLTQLSTDSRVWAGTLPLGATSPSAVRYLVQAVNGVGLVSLATNLGAYYTPLVEPYTAPSGQPTPPVATTLTWEQVPAYDEELRYGDMITLSARLEDDQGAPLAGQVIRFGVTSHRRTAITNQQGEAEVQLSLLVPTQTYHPLAAIFAGTEAYQATQTELCCFFVDKQTSNLSLELIDSPDQSTQAVELMATLSDGNGRFLREKTVVFIISDATHTYSTSLITDYVGRIFLSVGEPDLPAGDYTIQAFFGGEIPLPAGSLTLEDPFYAFSTATLVEEQVTPPETTILAGPPSATYDLTATFIFTATDNATPADELIFECQVDGGNFVACESNGQQTYQDLSEGAHTFAVRAIDEHGNVDPSPATYGWTINAEPVGVLIGTCFEYTVYQVGETYTAAGWDGNIIVGTALQNNITGTAGPDLILGLGGNDILNGKGGDDVICGGEGNDLIYGELGNDRLDGGNHNDVLNGGTGNYDVLIGGEGNDTLLDPDGVAELLGGPGNDQINLSLHAGWRDEAGAPTFVNRFAAGLGNDTVTFGILGQTTFVVRITGDEWEDTDGEGTADTIRFAGRIQRDASEFLKFEGQVIIATSALPVITDETGFEFWVDEPVEAGTNQDIQLFLPFVRN